jgi:DNA-binding protein Fis
MVCENSELQWMIDNFNSLAGQYGFEFLNSRESIKLQDEMRSLESRLLNGSQVETLVNLEINTYENSMIRNIYNYCEKNEFNSAIFMCGVAHRKSIIEKLDKLKAGKPTKPSWLIFEY